VKKAKTKRPALEELSALAIKQAEPAAVLPEETSDIEAEEISVVPAPEPKFRTTLLIAGASLAIVAVAVTAILLFSRVSVATVYLGGTPIKTTQNQEQLQQQIATAAAGYQLKLDYLGGQQKSYRLKAAGISVDPAASAAAAKHQLSRSFLQRLTWWKPIKLKLIIRTDKTKLKSFIDSKVTAGDKRTKNANLTIKNGSVILTAESAGRGYVLKNAEPTILAAVSILSPQPLKPEATKLEPAITSKDLAPSQTKAEATLAQKVSLSIKGQVLTARPADIGNWIDLNPVPSSKTLDVSINSGKVLQYINQIAYPYIQPPRSRLIMKTSHGSTVLDGGANGVDVLNKNQTAANIAQAINAGKGYSGDLPVSYAAAQTVEVKPAPKWIIVDVTTKRMYAYQQTKMVKTFLISAGAPNTPTVLGKFAIYRKYASQDMRGANADGSRYFQPDVPYVNYFYGDYAIHGNYWRPSSYFGNINSSHGCVGVTVSDGAWIYQWAPVGTPVIVHT
jgi:lipoprotein-anchoring transpeptidase ErfK/SrfK